MRYLQMACNIELPSTAPTARRELPKRIERFDPDEVAVLQAYNDQEYLQRLCQDLGYKRRQYTGKESSGIAVLIKEGVVIESRRPIQMKEWWEGPKLGIKHPPRTYPSIRINKTRDKEDILRTLSVHFPTPEGNEKAMWESLNACERWLTTDAPSIVLGDMNLKRERTVFLERLADKVDGKLLRVGAVDYGIAVNFKKFESQKIRTPLGCHGWGMYEFVF